MAKSDLIPFGKYKGQPVEVLAQDREYCEWLMEQEWFRTKFQPIYTIIVNNYGAPAETPEHNQLQARFTDPDFRRRFVRHIVGQPAIDEELRALIADLDKGIARQMKELEKARESAGQPWRIRADDPNREQKIEQDSDVRNIQKSLGADRSYLEKLRQPNPPEMLTEVEFEVDGMDVILRFRLFPRSPGARFAYGSGEELLIECKPSLGDDYPAVLRQIARYRSHSYNPATPVLLIGDGGYTATGATLEQVRTIFESRQVRILFLKDLR